MTNHHVPGIFAQLGELLRVWRQRHSARLELAQWTERDMQDVGASRSDVAGELQKPFWRA
jgi:uncharacterized protein YjiS (DUF1127 family)